MEKPIIEIKNLGKKYNIAHQRGGYIALRDVMMNAVKSPFSFLKSKAKQVAGMETKEEFWALKDLNFEVNKGEVIGIIGRNGAGKSTLLKILSQITPPTTGEIKIRGRVGSLLEVGTGFHPELTGRENIFLNGAILGMTKSEIAKKFDQIVEFAGIEKFLDTPVKYYSSGMYVRLAFSVAAHMEPDILIVDEVLAVGDAEFQKKCLGKMEEVTKQDGRTILFVSHNMGAIEQLCKKTIFLEKGRIKDFGETSSIIEQYLHRSIKNVPFNERTDRKGDGRIKIMKTVFKDLAGNEIKTIETGQDVELLIYYKLLDKTIKNINIAVCFDSVLTKNRVGFISNNLINKKITPAEDPIKIKIKNIPLNYGEYSVTYFIDSHNDILDWIQNAETIQVKIKNGYHTETVHKADKTDMFFEFDIES